MSEVFGAVYADNYDRFYHDKDYGEECALIESIFQTYADNVRTVLDLGCGTGNHALPLAQRGYEVVGIDRSADMLARARQKSMRAGINGNLVFHRGNIQSTDLKRDFDAVLMMFAVLGYQLENADVLAALRTARCHLRSGGIFLFDVWYGPAVLRQRPSQRFKVLRDAEGEQILRATSGELDINRHLCRVRYHVWKLKNGQLTEETEENHSVRYFFPLELKLFLECSEFAAIKFGALPEFNRDPDETAWNLLAVARAV